MWRWWHVLVLLFLYFLKNDWSGLAFRSLFFLWFRSLSMLHFNFLFLLRYWFTPVEVGYLSTKRWQVIRRDFEIIGFFFFLVLFCYVVYIRCHRKEQINGSFKDFQKFFYFFMIQMLIGILFTYIFLITRVELKIKALRDPIQESLQSNYLIEKQNLIKMSKIITNSRWSISVCTKESLAKAVNNHRHYII